MAQNREISLHQTTHRTLRPFRYLRIPPQERERVHLVRERVKCGKPSCRCVRGLRHGPYTFLRYHYWDDIAGRDRYAREYVPRSELRRVRRWIRRARAETALGWGQAGLLRRKIASHLISSRRDLSDCRLASETSHADRPANVVSLVVLQREPDNP